MNDRLRAGHFPHAQRAVRRGAIFGALATVAMAFACGHAALAAAPDDGSPEAAARLLLIGVQALLAALFGSTLVLTWLLRGAVQRGDRDAMRGALHGSTTALWWSLGLLVVQAMTILIPLAVDASERREWADLWPAIVIAVLPAAVLWFWLNDLYAARAEVRRSLSDA